MSVVLTGEFNEHTSEYQILCESCKRAVGWASRAECSWIAGKSKRVLCFDCEGDWSDVIPEQLSPSADEIIIVGWPTGKKVILFKASDSRILGARYEARDSAVCLSSTTNLHAGLEGQSDRPETSLGGGV